MRVFFSKQQRGEKQDTQQSITASFSDNGDVIRAILKAEAPANYNYTQAQKLNNCLQQYGEPVWPSGKALVRQVSRRASVRFRFWLSFLFKEAVVRGRCLVTLSLTMNETFEMALIDAQFSEGVILVVTV